MPILQANSLHCFVCGMQNPVGLHLRFYSQGSEEVVADITIPRQYQGYPGVVHGGIVAAVLDEAAGRSIMGEGVARFMVTARLEIRYRQQVPVEQPLHLSGKVDKDRGRTATASARICDSNGKVLAEGEALLVNMPSEDIPTDDMEALGWKVYPLEVENTRKGEKELEDDCGVPSSG